MNHLPNLSSNYGKQSDAPEPKARKSIILPAIVTFILVFLGTFVGSLFLK